MNWVARIITEGRSTKCSAGALPRQVNPTVRCCLTNESRALCTGLTGAGSIFPVIFSLLGGWIIAEFGFTLFFYVIHTFYSFIVLFHLQN